LRVLLGVLREIGATEAVTADASLDMSPIAAIERQFRRHLAEERGLTDSTCVNYVSVVRRLLLGRFGGGSVRLDELRPDDVTRFLVRQSRTSPRRMKVIVPALRVFLRSLHEHGDTGTNLAGCVPSMPGWRLAMVPKALPSEQVERLLRHYDRATAVGRRDYAIVLLLARLGLRAGEVVHIDLDDLDWESGELRVRGKGGRQDRLPVPRDVGAAVADYLRHGRPRCSIRRVFVRAKAPLRGFVDASAISDIVNRGLKRAGLEPPRRGAHTLRHALACTMLRRGASLIEIGQILRHRNPDTTALYAKVDIASLRALAPAWPQAAGDA
jgi:site-specific recombinase XerD